MHFVSPPCENKEPSLPWTPSHAGLRAASWTAFTRVASGPEIPILNKTMHLEAEELLCKWMVEHNSTNGSFLWDLPSKSCHATAPRWVPGWVLVANKPTAGGIGWCPNNSPTNIVLGTGHHCGTKPNINHQRDGKKHPLVQGFGQPAQSQQQCYQGAISQSSRLILACLRTKGFI